MKTDYVFPPDLEPKLVSEINRLIMNPLNLQLSLTENSNYSISPIKQDSLDLDAADVIATEFEKAVQENRATNGYRILPAGDALTVQRVKVIG